MVQKYLSVCLLLFALMPWVVDVAAYNDDVTHPDITEQAAESSSLTISLKKQIGLSNGIVTIFKKGNKENSITDWLRDGSTDEDDPDCRASNHFHNPLKPWDQSHMSDDVVSNPLAWAVARAFCESEGWTYDERKSNVTWATGFLSPAPDGPKDDTFSTDPNFSPVNWDVARGYYYNALTSLTDEDRESNYALTFASVGHIIHLLEDMAVPAHTRNDFELHVVFNEIDSADVSKWFGNLYEYYVKLKFALVDLTPIEPSFSGPVLTDFWDTDQYINGGDPVAGNAIGLAEYTNANFLSLETIFESSDPLHGFQHPEWGSVVEYEEDIGGNKRIYLRKLGEGETSDSKIGFGEHIEHLARGKWFYKYLPSYIQNKGLTLDDAVYQDYAEKLLPRAVGYSAALINYFFRGKIKPVDLESILNGNNDITQLTMKIKNNTPDESMLPGTIPDESKLIVSYRYKLSGGDFIYGTTNELIMNEEIASGAVSTSDYTFNFNPVIPNNAEEAEFWIVYKGKLGNEEGAVVAKYIEPVSILIIPGDHATRELLPKQYHNFSVITKTFTETVENDLLFNILDDSAGWDENTLTWTAKADDDGLGVPLSVGGPQYMAKYRDEENNTVRIVTNLSYEKETYNAYYITYNNSQSQVIKDFYYVTFVGSPMLSFGAYQENVGYMEYLTREINQEEHTGLYSIRPVLASGPNDRLFSLYTTLNFEDRFLEYDATRYYDFDQSIDDQALPKDDDAPFPSIVSVTNTGSEINIRTPLVYDNYIRPTTYWEGTTVGWGSSGAENYTWELGSSTGTEDKCISEDHNCGTIYKQGETSSLASSFDIPYNYNSWVHVVRDSVGQQYYEELYINGQNVETSVVSTDKLETHYQILAVYNNIAVVRKTTYQSYAEIPLDYTYVNNQYRVYEQQTQYEARYYAYINGNRCDLPGVTTVISKMLNTPYDETQTGLPEADYLTFSPIEDITGYHPDRIFLSETFDGEYVLIAYDEYSYNNGYGFEHIIRYEESDAGDGQYILYYDIQPEEIQNADHEATRVGRQLLLFKADGTLIKELTDPVGLVDSIGSIGILN